MSLLAAILALSVAAPADGGVALAVSAPDQNARHREVVAGIVETLRARQAFLHPPLSVEDVALCRGELPCVHALATRQGAGWLLSIGVAGVGARDALVTFALLDAAGAVVVEETAVVRGSADPRRDGASLAPRLLAVPGIAPPVAVVERAVLPPPRVFDVPAAALVGGGAVVAGAAMATSLTLVGDPGTRDAALPVALGGGLVGLGCAAVGAALVVADTLRD